MSQIKDPVLKQAAADATDWLIRLQEDPDNADLKAQFEDWCARDQTHRDAWHATHKASSLMAQVAPAATDASEAGTETETETVTVTGDWQTFLRDQRAQESASQTGGAAADGAGPTHNDDTNVVASQGRFARLRSGRRRGNGSWRAIGLGAVAIAASLLVAVVGPKISTRLQADYSTDTGQMTTITLADKSHVTLAPESAIRVTFENDVRAIELLGGEAFFEVTPDPARPFTVAARNLDVTVLGTGFDVSEGAGLTRVAVAHGLVQVDSAAHLAANFAAHSAAHSERLEPGQNVWVDDEGAVVRGTVPADQIAPWRTRQLIAQDQPLGDIVDQLRRYVNGTIIITDDALASRSVTGVYRLSDPVTALRAIARAQNAVVREITPWVLVVSPS